MERRPVSALAAEAVPVVVVNPRPRLRQGHWELAKTDSLDAAVLAHFAEAAACAPSAGTPRPRLKLWPPAGTVMTMLARRRTA